MTVSEVVFDWNHGSTIVQNWCCRWSNSIESNNRVITSIQDDLHSIIIQGKENTSGVEDFLSGVVWIYRSPPHRKSCCQRVVTNSPSERSTIGVAKDLLGDTFALLFSTQADCCIVQYIFSIQMTVIQADSKKLLSWVVLLAIGYAPESHVTRVW